MDEESALKVAIKRLSFEELKDEQMEAIKAFVSGNDVFISLPTGYGKSLCYQILPITFDALNGHINRSGGDPVNFCFDRSG